MRGWIAGAALLGAAALGGAPSAEAADALGLNVHQSTGVGLDATRDAKLGWVRIDMNWKDAEPSAGALDFTLFDAVVDGAKARGLEVLAVVAYGPAWASSGDAMADGSTNDVPLPGTYAAFVTATVTHFKDRVTHYELWNEPNLSVFFEGTPEQYASGILAPGADAVHAACPSCLVVGPGLATVGGQYDVWMDAALTAAKDKIDIVSGHVYAGFPENGPGTTSDDFFQKLEAHRVVKLGSTVVYEGPLAFREVMQAHGVTAPFWLTETGFEAALGDAPALDKQTKYYRHVLEAMLTRPWWTGTIFYEAFDEPPAPYRFGVVVDDPAAASGYDPKPVMALLQKAVSTQKVFGGNGHDCDDGLDDDGDGLIDYPADPDCTSILGNSEGLPPPDGGLGGGGAGGAGGGAAGPGAGGAPAGDASPPAPGGCGCEVIAADPGIPWAFWCSVAGLALAAGRRSRWRETGPRRRVSLRAAP